MFGYYALFIRNNDFKKKGKCHCGTACEGKSVNLLHRCLKCGTEVSAKCPEAHREKCIVDENRSLFDSYDRQSDYNLSRLYGPQRVQEGEIHLLTILDFPVIEWQPFSLGRE